MTDCEQAIVVGLHIICLAFMRARQTEADTNALTFSTHVSRVNLNLSAKRENGRNNPLWTVTVDEMAPLTGLMLLA